MRYGQNRNWKGETFRVLSLVKEMSQLVFLQKTPLFTFKYIMEYGDHFY